jgi:RNA polymerase sigma-70 factor (family 1)
VEPNKLNIEDNYHDLQNRVCEGDIAAFRVIFDSLFNRLNHFAYSFVQNKEAAVDIVDDLFTKLWLNRQHIVEIKNLRVYLYTATKNASLNYLSAKAKEIITESYDYINIQITDNNNPEKLMVTQEFQKKINEAIESLPPRCKLVFKLVREDGLKYAEVANILNLSIKTIDNQMVMAVSKIRESMKGILEINKPKIFSKK